MGEITSTRTFNLWNKSPSYTFSIQFVFKVINIICSNIMALLYTNTNSVLVAEGMNFSKKLKNQTKILADFMNMLI